MCRLPEALSLGDQPFDAAVWRNSPDRRADMLRSLGAGASFEGRTPEQITKLLGPGECYVDYEDQPCYEVPVGDSKDTLVFYVAHSGANIGSITNAMLEENGSGAGGCLF